MKRIRLLAVTCGFLAACQAARLAAIPQLISIIAYFHLECAVAAAVSPTLGRFTGVQNNFHLNCISMYTARQSLANLHCGRFVLKVQISKVYSTEKVDQNQFLTGQRKKQNKNHKIQYASD